MSGSVGYKQQYEYFNEVPEIANKIKNMSSICPCRYNPELPKTDDVNVFMSRPERYHFTLKVHIPGISTLFSHVLYFDKLKDAEKAHEVYRAQYYETKTEPYRAKVEAGKKLTLGEEELVNNINKEIKDLKNHRLAS